MPEIDKTSVRESVDQLTADFESLCAKGKVSPEMKIIMNSMLMIIKLILSVFMEKVTKKDSKNSSIPPSQTGKDDSALGQSGTNGKGKGENRSSAKNTRVVTLFLASPVDVCDVCGADLSTTPCTGHERRTKIDIVFEKVVEHMDAEIKDCPSCDSVVTGSFPSDLHGPLQYGEGLKAYVINLIVCQMIALSRVQKLVSAMIGSMLSEATLLKFVWRLYEALQDWEDQAIEKILSAPAINVDETSLRVDKKNHWIHVYSAGDITLKFLRRGRSIEMINSIGIIPRYGGVIIHDCLHAYLSFDHCQNALCGSHLLRELTFVVDSNGYAWASDMKRLLQTSCSDVSKNPNKCLDEAELVKLHNRYSEILKKGKEELPLVLPKPKGKRGRQAKSDAHNLFERFDKYKSAVLLFAENPHVSFTNNRAERDLRMSKVKQKVSGCFRAKAYAEAYCRISSYLQSMSNKGVNPLIAIQIALSGSAKVE